MTARCNHTVSGILISEPGILSYPCINSHRGRPDERTHYRKRQLKRIERCSRLIQAGFLVSLPFGGGAPDDLIVDTGERLLKVQVKTGRLRNGCVLFAAQRISGHHGTKRRRYEESEFDVYAVYCSDNDRIDVLPWLGDLAEGRL
jgi:hypothetical protein